MKRAAIALSAGIVLIGLVPGAVMAKPSIDQSYPTCTTGTGGPSVLAQTFRAGRTGALTEVDLYISKPTTTLVTADILNTSGVGTGAAPGGNVLDHGSASVGGIHWYKFPLSKKLIVTVGHEYAIELALGSTGYWCGGASPAYGGGKSWVQNPTWSSLSGTLDFKTLVDPAVAPTPSPSPKPTAKPTAVSTRTPGAGQSPSAGPSDSSSPSATDSGEPGSTESPSAADTTLLSASDPTVLPSAAASPAAGSGSGSGDSGSSPILIAVGGVAGLAVIGGGIAFFLRRRRQPAA